MKFKEFSAWCNERACDGCWGMMEAMICCNVCSDIYKLPFWKREKYWKECAEKEIMPIVNATNEKIKEIMGVNTLKRRNKYYVN